MRIYCFCQKQKPNRTLMPYSSVVLIVLAINLLFFPLMTTVEKRSQNTTAILWYTLVALDESAVCLDACQGWELNQV